MAIYRLLRNSAFDPETVKTMIAAYEEACRLLRLPEPKYDPAAEVLALKIIEIGQTGERDSATICARALEELGLPGPS